MRAPTLTMKRAKALRRERNLPETILWSHLRGARLRGLRWRHQHPQGPYILDFYCSKAKLCVEIDGPGHHDAAHIAHDAARDAYLAGLGIHVLRRPAKDVLNSDLLEGVLTQIADLAVSRLR